MIDIGSGHAKVSMSCYIKMGSWYRGRRKHDWRL